MIASLCDLSLLGGVFYSFLGHREGAYNPKLPCVT